MPSIWNRFHSAFSRCAASLLASGFALLLLAPSLQAQTYTTNFPLTENPISEGGRWLNGATNGIDWGNVSTTPGQTHDHSGPARYADATAIMTGSWGADQTVQETVYAGAVSGAPEVEIRLRSALSAHNCSGYEITHSVANGQNGNYLIIVRWNGPLANFTYLTSLSGAQYSVTTGDVVKATMVGSVITVYKNGVQEAQVSDSTFATGNPGIGFNEQTNGTYGITSFTASDTTVVNNPPTVATAASANPNTASGTTTALSVLGGDDGGEPALTYTWATTGSAPAAVAFSANGTHAAKATTATFTKAGSYAFQVVIRDAGGLTATSNVGTTVNQTLTAITVSPATVSVPTGGIQTFIATAKDQFTLALAAQPAFAWTVSGGGTISTTGIFTAGSTSGGPFTVTAASGGKSGTGSMSVTASSTFAVKINFQPAASPTVAGYLVDAGLPFAARGNGYSYGWNADLGDASRDRNLVADQLRDTLIHMQKSNHPPGVWELAVPNGIYRVYLVSGDPGYTDSVYGINVEGVLAVSGTPTAAAPFRDSGAGGIQVTVSDGRLTVSNAASGVNNKVCYIEVTQVPTGSN